jgi:NADH-quinone oxidoreductase subunit M
VGIFSLTQLGMDGAVYQMINHGISTGGLFLIVAFLAQRRGSTAIQDFGGVAHRAPWLATAFLITTLAGIGLPTLNSFVGEFLVLQGAAQANFRYAVFSAIGVVLSACYMLWLYQRLFYNARPERIYPDLDTREWMCMVPMIALMFWLGIGTGSFLPAITGATHKMLDESAQHVPYRVQSHPVRLEVAKRAR